MNTPPPGAAVTPGTTTDDNKLKLTKAGAITVMAAIREGNELHAMLMAKQLEIKRLTDMIQARPTTRHVMRGPGTRFSIRRGLPAR